VEGLESRRDYRVQVIREMTFNWTDEVEKIVGCVELQPQTQKGYSFDVNHQPNLKKVDLQAFNIFIALPRMPLASEPR
jgi:hypothetical protein